MLAFFIFDFGAAYWCAISSNIIIQAQYRYR